MSNSGSNEIGYVTLVRGKGIQARIAGANDEAVHSLTSGDEHQTIGQIGSYLIIEQANIKILAIVTEASLEESELSNSVDIKIIPAANRRLTIDMIPLGEFSEKDGFQRGVKNFPTPGAPVYTISIENISKLFSIYQDLGFNVGCFSTHQSLEFCLNPSVLFGRHFAILGQSGSGKSWTVASLLQRAVAVMPKAHIILLDLHGEYCWYDESREMQSAFEKNTVRYVPAQQLEIPYWIMTFEELVDLFIDRSDPGASIQMAFFRDIIFDLKKKAGNELGMTTVSVDSPIYFSLIDVYERFKKTNQERSDFGKTKGPLFGQFDKFLVKLQSRLNDVRYDFLLKPRRRKTSASLSGLLRDFVGLGDPKCQITVIDLSLIPSDVRPSISAQIGRVAFEFNYWNPRNREFPILLLCEEAHTYIPRESNTRFEGTRKSMERIAKEGRKYGVGLGVVSQRPHELSETVLAQCGTFICLRITNPDDQDYVRDLVPEAEGDLTTTLTSLGRGEAMVLGEAAVLPTRFQVHRPNPPPNSNDIDFHKAWNTGPDDLDVDSIVDRWRHQGQH